MNKPIIGINAEFRGANGSQPSFSYLASGYYDSIARAGGIPVILPPALDTEGMNRILETLDGFVMVGGADLDPRNDGYMLHSTTKPMEPRREHFDRLLMREIVERRMPVLAIGSGMQLLNVTCGGTLLLHIPEDVPNCLPHRDSQDPSHRHSLVIESDSLIGRVYGEGEIRVTSRHHMAVDDVAEGFRVTAKCQDGVVEVMESEMVDWFAIATQFHPECQAASALDIRIFEEFLEALSKPQLSTQEAGEEMLVRAA